jgi:hypothetical protein
MDHGAPLLPHRHPIHGQRVEEVLPAAKIMDGHLVVFNYDGDHQVTVTVFDETMCRWHYVATARGKAAVSSFSSEDDQ